MANVADIFEAIIRPTDGGFSPDLAQHVLGLTFSAEQVARYRDLAGRVQDGSLSDNEKSELEAFVQANTILMIMQSKARRSLVENTTPA